MSTQQAVALLRCVESAAGSADDEGRD